jgi:hypothetical protein
MGYLFIRSWKCLLPFWLKLPPGGRRWLSLPSSSASPKLIFVSSLSLKRMCILYAPDILFNTDHLAIRNKTKQSCVISHKSNVTHLNLKVSLILSSVCLLLPWTRVSLHSHVVLLLVNKSRPIAEANSAAFANVISRWAQMSSGTDRY